MHLASRAPSVKVSAPAHAIHRSPARARARPGIAACRPRCSAWRRRAIACRRCRCAPGPRSPRRCSLLPDALRSEQAARGRGGGAADRRRRVRRARRLAAPGAGRRPAAARRARRAARPLPAGERQRAATASRSGCAPRSAARWSAYRTFLRTLLHELCHHLDYTYLHLRDSLHTQGFYQRESSLFAALGASRRRRSGGTPRALTRCGGTCVGSPKG